MKGFLCGGPQHSFFILPAFLNERELASLRLCNSIKRKVSNEHVANIAFPSRFKATFMRRVGKRVFGTWTLRGVRA